MHLRFSAASALLALAGSIQLSGAAFNFSAISACPGCSTEPFGINDSGVVSGTYFDPDGNSHSFLKSGGIYTLFDPNVAGLVFDEAGHINNAGQIAGDYVGGDGIDRPFIRNANGTFTLEPGFSDATGTAAVTFAVGITNAGQLVGSYTFDPNGATGFIGYILSGNTFTTTFNFPGATATFALDVNNAGTIVGSFKTNVPNAEHGFIRDPNGTLHQIDFPGSQQTELFGINGAGVIVGRYLDAAGVQHGLILNGTTFTTLDYKDPSGDPNTYAWGINNQGQIVGYSFPGDPSAGPYSGFQADPVPEPASWTMLLVAVCVSLPLLIRKIASQPSLPGCDY